MLELRDVTKRYKLRTGVFSKAPITVVDGVTFDVAEGETIGLVGESGCGKSTLGACILRLVAIDEGTIRLDGEDIHSIPEKQFRPIRKAVQMVFQYPTTSFDPLRTIGQSLLEPMGLRTGLSRNEKRDEVSRLLEIVHLPRDFAERLPHELSGGQLQRVALARALAPGPKLVFLDEPTAALDMSIKGQIVNLLLELQEERRISYVLVTHDLRVTRFVADRVLVMYGGQIMEMGSKEAVYREPLHPYTHALMSATRMGRWKAGAVDRFSLRGEVVFEDFATGGCKLRHRCAFATEDCREPQALREAASGRWVRCGRAGEIPLSSS
jgi:oligopeptide/dipeptide ABC transporter ATP-binding protein